MSGISSKPKTNSLNRRLISILNLIPGMRLPILFTLTGHASRLFCFLLNGTYSRRRPRFVIIIVTTVFHIVLSISHFALIKLIFIFTSHFHIFEMEAACNILPLKRTHLRNSTANFIAQAQ